MGNCNSYGQKKLASDYNLKKAIELLQNDGDEKEVMKYLDLQLGETPQNADVYMTKATVYRKQKRYDMALSSINKALKFYQKNGMFPKYSMYWWRASIYEKLEEYDKALADYGTTYKIALKEALENISDILYQRAQVYFNLKDYEAADADYRLMLKHNEADQVAMIGLVRNMMERGEYDKALELVNKCEKYNADYDEIYRFRMQIYDKTDETDKAIDDAIAYFDKSDNPSSELINPILKKHLSYALALVNAKLPMKTITTVGKCYARPSMNWAMTMYVLLQPTMT